MSWRKKALVSALCMTFAAGAALAKDYSKKSRTRSSTIESLINWSDNEDGSRTRTETKTVTSDNDKTTTITKKRTVQKEKDGGRSWTSSWDLSDWKGRTASATGEGKGWKTGDGWAWTRKNSGTNRRGAAWSSETNGSGKRTTNGRSWSSVTNGSNAKGRTWNVNRLGDLVRNGDGTRTRNFRAEGSDNTGFSWNRRWTRNSQRAGSGRTWTHEGSGSNSRGRSWTTTGEGESVRNSDGSRTRRGRYTRTGNGGSTRTLDLQGTGAKLGPGSYRWTGNRSVARTNGTLNDAFSGRKSATAASAKSGKSFKTQLGAVRGRSGKSAGVRVRVTKQTFGSHQSKTTHKNRARSSSTSRRSSRSRR